jgi:hypothetical protein
MLMVFIVVFQKKAEMKRRFIWHLPGTALSGSWQSAWVCHLAGGQLIFLANINEKPDSAHCLDGCIPVLEGGVVKIVLTLSRAASRVSFCHAAALGRPC